MAEGSAPERSTMRSVERTFDVIDTLADSGRPLRLAELARGADLHIATAQRILKVLERRDFVTQSAGNYTVGPAALAAAHSYLIGNQLVLAATPVLQELAEALGLTASLSVRVGDARVLVARVEGGSPLRYQLPIGGRLPLHLGAGKMFLAELPAAERAEVLDKLGEELVMAGGEKVSRAEFAARLDEIAARGYAISRNERVVGALSVAAPVRSRDGEVLGVVQVSGRDEDVDDARLKEAEREVVNACASIAARTH
ncbi:IclR family transcriptional regulator [Amycolatopsis sp. FU40]|uniref:IclR family transcriptional regulator n=1 Tax=Amycolatopsis sp. FU40 TaxID=2914159 RepID=UPI001F230D8B|nr:IclR family transcriptional regulator [Amycolatopsis sp. FU40]UKD57071.1 IclR family transcriptional regulator [Amycolatopsis sp. FU40]